MAHRGVWIPGVWKIDAGETLKKGQFFRQKADSGGAAGSRDRASAGVIERCTAVGEMPFGVAYSDMEANDLLDGHHAGAPSEVIEVKAGAAIGAGKEIIVNASGEAIEFDDSTHGECYIIGLSRRAAASGDLFEVNVRQRYESS